MKHSFWNYINHAFTHQSLTKAIPAQTCLHLNIWRFSQLRFPFLKYAKVSVKLPKKKKKKKKKKKRRRGGGGKKRKEKKRKEKKRKEKRRKEEKKKEKKDTTVVMFNSLYQPIKKKKNQER
jgi:hypothetical protein